jgi:hypothetical protein
VKLLEPFRVKDERYGWRNEEGPGGVFALSGTMFFLRL